MPQPDDRAVGTAAAPPYSIIRAADYPGRSDSAPSLEQSAGVRIRRPDQRARFDEALRRAQEAAFGPGEYVEQESFMRAARDPGARRAGRRRAGRLRSRPVLRGRRAGPVPHARARLRLPRRRRERERGRDRARARRAACRAASRSRADPAAPAGHLRRRAPARDDARLPRQGGAARGGLRRAPARRTVRVHAGGGRCR